MTDLQHLPEITIAGRLIGRQHPPYVIAELSANHLGKLSHAMATLEMAATMGADAVKLQTYRADTITIDHDGPGFRIEGGLWHGRTLYDLYEEAHMPWAWHAPLMERGKALGVAVFSSPFDPTAVDFLAALDVPAYKIASFEAIDLPLIDKAASQGKPLIVSTGMASHAEIAEAYAHASAGRGGVALLHCISGYPTPIREANLATIPDLARRFPDAVIGLSDHTLGTVAATAAIACGAAIIEKHVTLSRADGGTDAAFSLEPGELKTLVTDCRAAWEALGVPAEDLQSSESGNIVFRRSLYAVADIPAGASFTQHNVRSIRPGFGLAPKRLPDILGRRATRAIRRGEPLTDDMLG
jgi:pseudaminic acid synthase